MNQRTLLDRLLSPAGFGLVLLLFLLPFATVSCGVETEHVDATFTGLDLMVGGEPSLSGTNIDDQSEAELTALFVDRYDAEPLAILAAVLLLGGMAAALIRQRQLRSTVSAGIAAVVVVLLAVELFVRAPGKVGDAMAWFRAESGLQDPVTTSTSPAFAFWIAIVVLIGLAAWQGYEAVRANGPAVAAGPPPDTSPPGPAPSAPAPDASAPPLRPAEPAQDS
jgi:hypothetical protein